MAQQKLYTEEQVKRIAKLYIQELYILEAAINTETPIGLPSDEEIDKEASTIFIFGADQGKFIAGAKWLREQILNQTK